MEFERPYPSRSSQKYSLETALFETIDAANAPFLLAKLVEALHDKGILTDAEAASFVTRNFDRV